jgi:multidrug efflux pump subunit AcrA (membrane-fusion protein)
MEEEKIEIRSEEVQEILGQPPRWIIRWGITVLFAIVFLFLFSSWFFKYPDILIAPIVLTTENPPTPIIARNNGKISELFISDKQNVKANQYLAYIENPAIFSSFLETKIILDSLKRTMSHFDNELLNTDLKQDYTLGDLQSGYSSFTKQISVYKDFKKLNFHQRKISALKEQITKYEFYKSGLLDQLKITQNEHLLNKKQFLRDSVLLLQNLIPDADFEKSEKVFLQSKRSLREAGNNITSTQIRINELEQSILDLELNYTQQKTGIENELRSQYDNLLSQYAQFEHSFILKSPVEGTVAFTKYWSTNQSVTSGEFVFTVISSKPREIFGKVKLPLQRSGKVKVGLKVIIKLDNYPYREYGVLFGSVKSISLVPSENTYMLEVSLSKGLESNYHKKLDFTQEMQGTAEIVTEDMRLIERLIQPVKYILKKNLN